MSRLRCTLVQDQRTPAASSSIAQRSRTRSLFQRRDPRGGRAKSQRSSMLPIVGASSKCEHTRGPRDDDAGKKVHGRKRHIAVDPLGLIHALSVHEANVQERDGAQQVLAPLDGQRYPRLGTVWADAAYQGRLQDGTADELGLSGSGSHPNGKANAVSSRLQSAGSSSEPSPGSAAIAGSAKTTRQTQQAARVGSGAP